MNESLFDDSELFVCTANQVVACANGRTCQDEPVQITIKKPFKVGYESVPYVIYGTHSPFYNI